MDPTLTPTPGDPPTTTPIPFSLPPLSRSPTPNGLRSSSPTSEPDGEAQPDQAASTPSDPLNGEEVIITKINHVGGRMFGADEENTGNVEIVKVITVKEEPKEDLRMGGIEDFVPSKNGAEVDKAEGSLDDAAKIASDIDPKTISDANKAPHTDMEAELNANSTLTENAPIIHSTDPTPKSPTPPKAPQLPPSKSTQSSTNESTLPTNPRGRHGLTKEEMLAETKQMLTGHLSKGRSGGKTWGSSVLSGGLGSASKASTRSGNDGLQSLFSKGPLPPSNRTSSLGPGCPPRMSNDLVQKSNPLLDSDAMDVDKPTNSRRFRQATVESFQSGDEEMVGDKDKSEDVEPSEDDFSESDDEDEDDDEEEREDGPVDEEAIEEDEDKLIEDDEKEHEEASEFSNSDDDDNYSKSGAASEDEVEDAKQLYNLIVKRNQKIKRDGKLNSSQVNKEKEAKLALAAACKNSMEQSTQASRSKNDKKRSRPKKDEGQDVQGDDSDNASCLSDAPTKSRKRAKTVPSVEDDDSLFIQQESPVAKKTPRNGRRPGRPRKVAAPKPKAKPKPRAKYGSKVKNRQPGLNAAQAMILDFTGDDAIAARAAHGHVAEAPTLTIKGNRAKALAEIMRTVPKEFQKEAGQDRKEMISITKELGRKVLKPEGGKWCLKGMTSPLLHHQAIGFQRMVKLEAKGRDPRGGLLADSMGLGKTIMLLALIARNRPLPSKLLPTLVVLPPTLLCQWEAEIEKHMDREHRGEVQIYRGMRGKGKAKAKININLLKKANIILTTYHEVSASIPFPETKTKERKPERSEVTAEHLDDMMEDNLDDVKPERQRKTSTYDDCLDFIENQWDTRGDLHRLEFHRVILDEAHVIKNYKTRSSIACQKLQGLRRWVVTATPLQNSLLEFFPYLRFLGASYANNFAQYKSKYGDSKSIDTQERVTKVLNEIMIRRTQKNRMFGRPIVDIPRGAEDSIMLALSGPELVLYQLLEKRFITMINRYIEDGTIKTKFATLMVLFLRLRQCISHPFLLQKIFADYFSLEDMDELERNLSQLSEKSSLLKDIQEWAKDARPIVEQRGDRSPSISKKFGQSRSSAFGKYFLGLDKEQMLENSTCRICADIPAKPAVIGNCHHVFCSDCLKGALEESEHQTEDDQLFCPHCHRMMDCDNPYQIFEKDPHHLNPDFESNLSDVEEDDEVPDDFGAATTSAGAKRGKGKKPKKGKYAGLVIPKDLMHSTKTQAVMARIAIILSGAPNDKIVVFSQFRGTLRILSKAAHDAGWNNAIMTGETNLDERDKLIKEFSTDPNCCIMFAGLKVGGVGLNLTAANYVITVDLWWNHSIERQAFGRIFRIGQAKESTFLRLIVPGTIDERIIKIQARKQKIIDLAMSDPNEKVEPLKLEEALSIFGEKYVNGRGITQLRVYRSYPESEPRLQDMIPRTIFQSDD
ncbi:MAG: hypothetical protein M1814_000778 [Vezdaea aestivalis]|nr:MAG: hypothetical protein M1814_000778 [Vezdaea aestivalis]